MKRIVRFMIVMCLISAPAVTAGADARLNLRALTDKMAGYCTNVECILGTGSFVLDFWAGYVQKDGSVTVPYVFYPGFNFEVKAATDNRIKDGNLSIYRKEGNQWELFLTDTTYQVNPQIIIPDSLTSYDTVAVEFKPQDFIEGESFTPYVLTVVRCRYSGYMFFPDSTQLNNMYSMHFISRQMMTSTADLEARGFTLQMLRGGVGTCPETLPMYCEPGVVYRVECIGNPAVKKFELDIYDETLTKKIKTSRIGKSSASSLTVEFSVTKTGIYNLSFASPVARKYRYLYEPRRIIIVAARTEETD